MGEIMSKFKIHTKYKTKNGEVVPSVTTILNSQCGWNKSILMNWGIRMVKEGKDPHAYTKDAADTGTLAHALCEANINNEDYEIGADWTENQTARAMKALFAFKEWREQTKPKFVAAEMKLVSEKHKVGGTADGVFKIGKKLYIYDIKTSRDVYDEMKLQLGMYTHMYEEIQPKAKIDGGVILRLDKETGDFHYHSIHRDTLDIGAKIFLHYLETYKLKKEL
jgi:hypothetical protein